MEAGSSEQPRPLKVALVTSFPPSCGDLNEYGFHLASALEQDLTVDLIVLADQIESGQELAGFNVERCWRFNSLLTAWHLLRAFRSARPDVIWFNMGFSTFANNPLAAFLSISIPWLALRQGFYTHVTLHTIFERIDLQAAQVFSPALYRKAGRLATRLLLASGDVSVLMPSFRSELISAYRVSEHRIHYHSHGTFGSLLSPGAPYAPAGPTILAFGYWGTYKRLDLLLEALDEVRRQIPNVRLVVGGKNHPSTPGYLESFAGRWQGSDSVKFLGYVAEEDLPHLFGHARVLVLPYSSAAGTSGVVHQGCQYGLPMVAAEIPEFVEMAREQSIAIDFYRQGDCHTLARHLIRFLESDELCRRASDQNRSAAEAQPIAAIVQDYLRVFRQRISSPSMGARN